MFRFRRAATNSSESTSLNANSQSSTILSDTHNMSTSEISRHLKRLKAEMHAEQAHRGGNKTSLGNQKLADISRDIGKRARGDIAARFENRPATTHGYESRGGGKERGEAGGGKDGGGGGRTATCATPTYSYDTRAEEFGSLMNSTFDFLNARLELPDETARYKRAQTTPERWSWSSRGRNFKTSLFGHLSPWGKNTKDTATEKNSLLRNTALRNAVCQYVKEPC